MKIKGNQNLNVEKVQIDKNEVKKTLDKNEIDYSIWKSPIYSVIPIPVDKIESNNYNPNSVQDKEMELLATSILEDGFTQPIVVVKNPEKEGHYILIDGHHRHTLASNHEEIKRREKGTVPAVVLEKSLPDRIASTIRHNRARGTHSVEVMTSIVAGLSDAGLGDDYIKNKLGLDKEELFRLKQVSGITSLFKDKDFTKAWLSVDDIKNNPKNKKTLEDSENKEESLKEKLIKEQSEKVDKDFGELDDF